MGDPDLARSPARARRALTESESSYDDLENDANNDEDGTGDTDGGAASAAEGDRDGFLLRELSGTARAGPEERDALICDRDGAAPPPNQDIEDENVVTKLTRPNGSATKSFLVHEQDGLPGEEQRAFE